MHCSLHDAANVIAQYDENSNGRLCFTEFNQMLLPATNETLRVMASSRDYSPSTIRSSVLSPSLEAAISKVFQSEIEFQRRTEGIKADLNVRYDFTVRGAFDLIDTLQPRNRIDRDEIRNYVDSYMRWLSEAELDAIIRRCDTDADESLSYLEFSEVVRGINPVFPVPASPVHVTHHVVHDGPAALHEISPLRRAYSPARSGLGILNFMIFSNLLTNL